MSSQRPAWLAVIVALSLSIAGLFGGGAATAQRAPALVSDPGAPLDSTRPSVPLPSDRDVRYHRSRYATVDVSLLRSARPGTTLHLPFFADANLDLVFDRVIASGRDEQSFVGHVPGLPTGTVILERVGDVVVGRVQTPEATFALQYAGNDTHLIHDVARLAFQVPDEPATVTTGGGPLLRRRPNSPEARKMRYLGVYTGAAQRAQGGKRGIKAATKLTVTWFNAAVAAQNVRHRLAFAGIKRVRGRDDGDTRQSLYAVTDPADGNYDEAHDYRDAKRADFVALLIAGDGSGYGACGHGWRPGELSPNNEDRAFTSIREDCNTVHGGLVGAHELLHNMGGCHPTWRDIEVCDSPTTRYSYGYVTEISPYQFAHTTLGTGAVCPRCLDLPTVSGKRPFDGSRVGNNQANMAKLINRGADIFARYR